MGVVCKNCTENEEIEIIKNNKCFQDNLMYRSVNNINKIKVIQRNFRSYKSKKIRDSLYEELKKQIERELDRNKLINEDLLLESKSEKYYRELINNKKIEQFNSIISNNIELQKELSYFKKSSFDLPFFVVTTSTYVYKGGWNYNKQFHGFGLLYKYNNINSNDSRIEGLFKKGQLNGYGRIISSNKIIIAGNFVNNKLEGKGEYIRPDGSVYKGNFREGLPQGNGEEFFNDGSHFKGFYLAGKKKYGKYEWKNGNSYQGIFDKNLFNGCGTYIWGDKKTYEGNWKNGKMHGKGKLLYQDGSYYEGDFKEGKKHGTGKYFWNENKYYKGEWKNDKENGVGEYFDNGKLIKGLWLNGEVVNSCSSTFRNFNGVTNLKQIRRHPTDIFPKTNFHLRTRKLIKLGEGLGGNNDISGMSPEKLGNKKLMTLTRNSFLSSKTNNSTNEFAHSGAEKSVNSSETNYVRVRTKDKMKIIKSKK